MDRGGVVIVSNKKLDSQISSFNKKLKDLITKSNENSLLEDNKSRLSLEKLFLIGSGGCNDDSNKNDNDNHNNNNNNNRPVTRPRSPRLGRTTAQRRGGKLWCSQGAS